LRSLSALQNTVGSRIVAIGSPSGWGHGGQKAPEIAANVWKLDIRTEPYDDLAKRIESANKEPERVARCEAAAAKYLKQSGISLHTATEFVSRAYLLTEVFEDLMEEHDAPAMTINECMTTIMPMSQTTACMCLTFINDSGAMAFCESDFVVIPSGILLKNIAGTPVFLNDPTYPHDGQITLAHCTAPRRMNGKKLEPAKIMTHFESDYGAAPMVKMDVGHVVTVLDPDFGNQRWIGFKGKILDNPELDICRSQVDVSIEGDWRLLAQEMRGFHWMMSYGDHLKETGYALRKMGVGWLNLTTERTIEA
jgi:L-fucose isomerase-like protein